MHVDMAAPSSGVTDRLGRSMPMLGQMRPPAAVTARASVAALMCCLLLLNRLVPGPDIFTTDKSERVMPEYLITYR
jgi:hypothetical protein